MKTKPTGLLSWANSHPTLTSLLNLLCFGSVPVTIGAKWADNPYAWAIGSALVFGLGGAWLVALWRHSKKLITLLLITAMMAAPLKQARAAMVGVGVIIVCVGGYCVYKVVKVCQKKFPPKDTNAPPESFSAAGSEYGGAYEYSSIGSCWSPPPPDLSASPYEDLTHNPTTFTLNVLVEPAGATISMCVNNAEGTAQDWVGFQSEMASHGLFITGHPGGEPQFEMGGVPCDPSMVPLEFDPYTGRVIHHTGDDLRRVTVERSINLQDWYPLLVTDTGIGSGFKVIDTTRESQMFYRVSMGTP